MASPTSVSSGRRAPVLTLLSRMKPRPVCASLVVRVRGIALRGLTATGTLLALALSVWPSMALAYRPFDSSDASVAGRGEVEVELGSLGYLVEGPDRTLVAPSLALSWGFAERWEAVLEGRHAVELGSHIEGPRLRLEDTGVSVKRVLREGSLQEKAGPSIATEAGVSLPTIHDEPGVGASWALVVSQRWRNLTVHVNGAAIWTRAHRPAAFGGLIFEVHDAWTVRPVGEVFVEHERDLPTTISGLVGVIWRVSDALSLDAAVRSARAGDLPATEIRAGLTYSFGVEPPSPRQ